MIRIVQQLLIFRAPFFRRDALREEVWIECRRGRQRENLAVVWIHRDDHAAPLRRLAKLIFGGFLQIQIDCRDDVLARLRLHALHFVLDVTATVDDHFAITLAAAQILVVNFLEAFLSDYVAGLVTLVVIFLLPQLLWADLADVTKHMRKLSVRRITPLRNLLDTQRRKFELMRIDPRDI